MKTVTKVIYVAVPNERHDKEYEVSRFSDIKGRSAAMVLAGMGWEVYKKTTTWEKVEEITHD